MKDYYENQYNTLKVLWTDFRDTKMEFIDRHSYLHDKYFNKMQKKRHFQ